MVRNVIDPCLPVSEFQTLWEIKVFSGHTPVINGDITTYHVPVLSVKERSLRVLVEYW